MSSYVKRETTGDSKWFDDARFGMFIHWGLYSMAARHEWVKNHEHIPDEKYDKYMKYFNPDMYDAKEWARRAKEAGMKYAVMTTKHHEGFCMFDSQYTDYKCTNSPAGRDLIREYVDAFRAEGIKVGFYYSLIDWHHPDFTIDFHHPRNTDDDTKEQNEKRDMRKYAEYMRNQVTELLTNYGKIDIMWFDFSYPDDVLPGKPWLTGKGKDDWEAEKLAELVRSLQPDILINNRMDIPQDIYTPEQYQPMQWVSDKETGELLTWEACHTFSGSWGYYRDEMTWKSDEMLIQMLINTVCIGGNLIMNVGPTSRGYFDGRAEKALDAYAKWMKYNSRSIYGCTMAEPEFEVPRGCRLTQSNDGSRVYIHLMEYPYAYLETHGFAGKIDYAQFLHDGSEILYIEKAIDHFSEATTESDDLVAFKIPPVKPDVVVPVIEVFLK